MGGLLLFGAKLLGGFMPLGGGNQLFVVVQLSSLRQKNRH